MRPFWSIMIPVYEPSELLEQTLRSVLEQDEGPERMQMVVVDDGSPTVDVAALVRRVAGDRIAYHRNATNLGLAGNWNQGIALAQGDWVHLLHQDDRVMPGFYRHMARADAAGPAVGAAFCHHAFIDGRGDTTHVSEQIQSEAGILSNAVSRLSRNQIVQCPAIVVRRAVYESLGGFRSDLAYALDWEMWVRIACTYEVWYEPEILAAYRVHQANETARLRSQSNLLTDIFQAIAIVREQVPLAIRAEVGQGILAKQHTEHLIDAGRLMRAGQPSLALDRVREACRCDPGFRWSQIWFRYQYWALKARGRHWVRKPPQVEMIPGKPERDEHSSSRV